METLLTPSDLPNSAMDTLLTPAEPLADGADSRTDGPVKAKENGASTNIARSGCFAVPWVPSRKGRKGS